MKFSNTLLLATVTVALAMVAVPADAQSLSRAPASSHASWPPSSTPAPRAPQLISGAPPSPPPFPYRPRSRARPRSEPGSRARPPPQSWSSSRPPPPPSPPTRPRQADDLDSRAGPDATPPTTRSATAASLEDISPQSNYYRSMEPVRRVHSNQYVSDLARFEQIKARRNRMSAIKNSAKHSLSDSGYNYESFDDEYDEGFSISEDAAFGDDDDAWEETWEE
ncbi:hypothetical protein GGF31_005680 [Allomyces arbusculus]|nr:hypothetical protein GGF31_005680 [Allomyces arbusculus]